MTNPIFFCTSHDGVTKILHRIYSRLCCLKSPFHEDVSDFSALFSVNSLYLEGKIIVYRILMLTEDSDYKNDSGTASVQVYQFVLSPIVYSGTVAGASKCFN